MDEPERPMRILLAPALMLAAAVTAAGSSQTDVRFEVSSGTERNTLVELYTSEGCSSCPPADRWLSNLEEDARLWRDIVPLALHVDYWDYIGWTDRFASDEYGLRQRRLAAESGALSIYTPGMFANGREWLGWRRGARVPVDSRPAGDLALRLSGDSLTVVYRSTTPLPDDLVVNVGVLGMNLSTQVRAGENRGKRLEHDFVLLGLTETSLVTGESGLSATAVVNVDEQATAPNALVAWVSSAGEQTPLQATGGFIASR
jgi:hypothetical protein